MRFLTTSTAEGGAYLDQTGYRTSREHALWRVAGRGNRLKLVADMIAQATAGDRPLLHEMLPGAIRARLFTAASWFTEAMANRVTH